MKHLACRNSFIGVACRWGPLLAFLLKNSTPVKAERKEKGERERKKAGSNFAAEFMRDPRDD